MEGTESGQRPRKLTKAEKTAKYRQDYQEPIKSRREHLKKIMLGPEAERERRARALNRDFLDEDYRSGANIYGMVVDMMKAMPDRTKTGGQNLAHWYLQDFGDWLERTGKEEELRSRFLTCEIQLAALKNCNANQKNLICQLFDISPEKLKKDIRECIDEAIKKTDFAVAADLALSHDFVDSYSFEDIILPLILTNKTETAYSMMAGRAHFFKELLEFLDKFVGLTEREVEEILLPYKKSHKMTISYERFVYKPVEKFINSVFTKSKEDIVDHQIDLAKHAPNYTRNSNEKTLKYHITERYDKPGSSDDVYFQHMESLLSAASPEARERTLFGLFDSKRNPEKQVDAISWALYFGLQTHTGCWLPGVMKDFFKSPDSRLQQAEALLKSRREQQRMPLHGEKLYANEEEKKYPIQMVCDESRLEQLCSNLKFLEDDRDPVYVGFDSEWKPSHILDPTQMKLALIQLFFREEVWLVDCIALESLRSKVRAETWQKFARRLLQSEKLKVIGFDLRNDLDAFLTIPALKHVLKIEDIKNTWCLKKLTENVCDIDMDILELVKKTFKLADLTEKLLGLKLDKSEQCSNWQCRPLRKKQIIYAAMDAVVVVEIFKRVLEMTKEWNSLVDIKKLMDDSNVMAPKKERSKIECRKMKTIPWEEIYETLRHCRDPTKELKRPFELKVIVDTMLLGFGKNLRRVGIDVYIPKDVNDFRDKLKLMKRLGGGFQRHIITVPSKSYEALRLEYADHTIAIQDLNSMSTMNQLIKFFNLFNVDIRREDEMIRCTACNSRLLVKFPGPVLHFLHHYCVVHLQNIYRADMNDFPLEEWWNKMNRINPDEYDGVIVKMSRPTPTSNWIVATVPTGCLHITRNTVIHNNLPEGVEVRIHKVPDDEFQRRGLCFYVCGDCGTVSFDGRPHIM